MQYQKQKELIMLRFLTELVRRLREGARTPAYDAFSHSPFYLNSHWQQPQRRRPLCCEEETLERLRDRWRIM